LVLQWWVTFRWNTEVNWTFDKFLVLIAWTVVLYLLTVFLYPPDLSEAEEHQGRFERNRGGYYSAFIAMCLLDLAQTAVHGELFQPVWYVPFVGQFASCWRRSHSQPTRLRSVFRVVPTGHNAGVGISCEKVFGRKRDDA